MTAPQWHDTEPGLPHSRAAEPGLPQGRAAGASGGRGHRRRSPHARTLRRWGSRRGRFGVLIVIGCAVLGAAATVTAGSEPGSALGVLVSAGTVAGALAVRPRAVYMIIPVPALAYVVAASAAGMIHDPAAGASRTALATSAAQWTAGGFVPMTTATVAAIAITAVRRQRRRRGARSAGLAARPGRPRGTQPDPAARRAQPAPAPAGRSPER